MHVIKEAPRPTVKHRHEWLLLVREREGDLYGCDECGETVYRGSRVPIISPIAATLISLTLGAALVGVLIWLAV